MKRVLLFIAIALLTNCTFAQLNVWRWQNPSVQGNTLNAVQMLSLKKTFACGARGTVIKTTDGGITWDVKSLLLRDSLNFNGLHYLDSNYGMVCGENGLIFKTTDGGNMWSSLTTSTTASLKGIIMIDTNYALAVGHRGTILRTSDGGVSWRQIPTEIDLQLTGIRKLRPDFITLIGEKGLLYKSIDSGSSWQRLYIKVDTTLIGNDINGQVFYDDNTALVVGNLGGIFSTKDGGKTWTNQSLGFLSSAPLTGIDGKDPSGSIYATVGLFGTIFNSTNSGSIWSKVDIGFTDSITAISFCNKFDAMAVGISGMIVKTTDGGASWTYFPSKPMTDPLNGIAFPKGDTSLGIAVGHYGTIMRTTNGGTHWDILPSITNNELKSVAFLTPLEICAVGQNGIVLRSHDGGVNWEPHGSGTSKFLISVSFPTANFGWAVGDSGIVISTIDGGSTWTIHPFSKKIIFTGVSFADSLHGYMCCGHGVYSTTDGGVTWNDPDDVTYYIECTSIFAPSPNQVSITYLPCPPFGDKNAPWILIVPGGIMTSHDGGKNWSNTDFFDYLSNVFFTDDLHGTAVGVFYPGKQRTGFIVHTTDGGMTWVQQDSHANNTLYGVAFGTKQAGTAVGVGGTIIRITTDEQ